MIDKKITRKEFLKIGFFGILSILAMPVLKLFGGGKEVSHKEARYYKDLAG